MHNIINRGRHVERDATVGKRRPCHLTGVSILLVLAAAGASGARDTALVQQIERHSAIKQKALALLNATPRLEITRRFGGDSRDTWRRILIDGSFGGVSKEQFLESALSGYADMRQELPKALQLLRRSHSALFGLGKNRNLMIRHAADPTFAPFGVHMSLSGAIAAISADNDEPVQAFQTIFETGQNTRGYVHKLECHAEAVEFIYAVTDIVYGVMLPAELQYGPDRVVADPTKIHMFYVSAGEVIALHPYVLHSGSLSVEPDRSFSIMIYKKPVQSGGLVVRLPDAWDDWRESVKLPEIDKYYLTLEELHTGELTANNGFIAAPKPLRLPAWK